MFSQIRRYKLLQCPYVKIHFSLCILHLVFFFSHNENALNGYRFPKNLAGVDTNFFYFPPGAGLSFWRMASGLCRHVT